jgi:CBS-domain-containing membrane protein
VDVISQSDLVSFVAKHHTTFDSLSDLRVAKCKGTSPVVSIPLQACVLDAIAQMYDRGVTAISVVNTNGQLAAVLSLSDLRVLNRARLNWVFLPIGVYLQRVYAVRNQVMSPLVVVRMETRFETLLLKFASTRLHRLFVVDAAQRPVGVITLTDLLLTVSALPTTEDEYTELFLENMLVDHWDSSFDEAAVPTPSGTPTLPLFAWSSPSRSF